MGPTWDPTGADRTQVGPMLAPSTPAGSHVGPMNLAIWDNYICSLWAVEMHWFGHFRHGPKQRAHKRLKRVRGDISWCRHQMETFSALLAICAGNSPVPGEFPTQRPVTRSFDVYFDLRPDKRLSRQSWGWWFETLSHSLWRHRNDLRNYPVGFHDSKATWKTISHRSELA